MTQQPTQNPLTSAIGMPVTPMQTAVTAGVLPMMVIGTGTVMPQTQALFNWIHLAEKERHLSLDIQPELDVLFDDDLSVEALQQQILGKNPNLEETPVLRPISLSFLRLKPY